MPLQLPALAAWQIRAVNDSIIANCIGCGAHADFGITGVSAEVIAHLEISQHDTGCPLDPLNRPGDPLDRSEGGTVEIGGQVMTQAQYDAARFPLIDERDRL